MRSRAPTLSHSVTTQLGPRPGKQTHTKQDIPGTQRSPPRSLSRPVLLLEYVGSGQPEAAELTRAHWICVKNK